AHREVCATCGRVAPQLGPELRSNSATFCPTLGHQDDLARQRSLLLKRVVLLQPMSLGGFGEFQRAADHRSPMAALELRVDGVGTDTLFVGCRIEHCEA